MKKESSYCDGHQTELGNAAKQTATTLTTRLSKGKGKGKKYRGDAMFDIIC